MIIALFFLQDVHCTQQEQQKKPAPKSEYQHAAAEHKNNARYRDYKNSVAEQQKEFNKTLREQDYQRSIAEQTKNNNTSKPK